MRFFRSERVQNLIQEEISKILVREVEVENAFLTVTRVDVDKKMDRAIVYVSVIPSSSAEGVLELLKKRTGALHHLLIKKINIKPMPQTIFAIDHGSENAAAVEKLLEDDRMREPKEE